MGKVLVRHVYEEESDKKTQKEFNSKQDAGSRQGEAEIIHDLIIPVDPFELRDRLADSNEQTFDRKNRNYT